jgi:hypothetical protein
MLQRALDLNGFNERLKYMMAVLWHAPCMGQMTNAGDILVGKPEGKRPFRSPGHR